MDGLLTTKEVCKLLNFSRATLYLRMKDPKFPQPMRYVSGGSLYFRMSEIAKLIGDSDAETEG